MSLKTLLGLEDVSISDTEIMKQIKEAMDKSSDSITFIAKDGSKVIVKLPSRDFSKQIDPWDGKPTKANYTQI